MALRPTLRRLAAWAVVLTLAATHAATPAKVVEISSVLSNPWQGLDTFDLVPFGDELINSVPFENQGVIFLRNAPLTNRPAGQFTNSLGAPGLPPAKNFPFQRGYFSADNKLTNQGQWLNSSGSKMVVDVAASGRVFVWNDGGSFVNSGASIDSFGGLIRNSAFVENCPAGPACGSANRNATFVNGNESRISNLSVEIGGGQIEYGQILNVNPTNLTAFPVISVLENSGIGGFIFNESGSTLVNRGAGAIVLNRDGGVITARHHSLIPNIAPGAIVNQDGAEFINRQGHVGLSNGGSFTNIAATFNNDGGGVTISTNSTLRNQNLASFNNRAGVVSIESKGSLTNQAQATFLNTSGAQLISSGSISNRGSGTHLTNEAGALIRVDGFGGVNSVISNAAGATLTSTGAGTTFNLRNGLLLNTGTGTTLINADGATFNGFTGSRISNEAGATIRNDGARFDLYPNSQFTNTSGASLINAAGGAMTNGGEFTNNQRGTLFSNDAGGRFGNYDGNLFNVGGATLRNSGAGTRFDNGAFFASRALLVNSGVDSQLLNEAGALLRNDAVGTIVNESNASFINAARLVNEGLIRNSADFVVSATGVIEGTGTYIQTAGTTTANGTITQGTFDCQGGTVNGTARITATTFLHYAKACDLDTGNSTGTLTLDGGAAGVAFEGTLNIEIAGLFDHDILRVLSGGIHFITASIHFIFEGYEPAAGDTFDFLDGMFDGTYSFSYEGLNAGYGFELARDANGHLGLHTLAVPGGGGGSVPLPGTLLLALLGLGAMGAFGLARARSGAG